LLVSYGDIIAVNLSQSSHAACTVLFYLSKHCVLLPTTLVCMLHLSSCVKLLAALSHVSTI